MPIDPKSFSLLSSPTHLKMYKDAVTYFWSDRKHRQTNKNTGMREPSAKFAIFLLHRALAE